MIIDWSAGDSTNYYYGGSWVHVWGFNVGALANLFQGMTQYRDTRRRCIIALLAGSLAWILI